MQIVEARTFGNEDGRKVMGFFPIDPKTYEIDIKEDIAFNGEILVGTSRGPMSFTFEFPEGYTLEDCFEHFKEIAEEAVEAQVKEAKEQNLIVTPDQMKSGGDMGGPILMP